MTAKEDEKDTDELTSISPLPLDISMASSPSPPSPPSPSVSISTGSSVPDPIPKRIASIPPPIPISTLPFTVNTIDTKHDHNHDQSPDPAIEKSLDDALHDLSIPSPTATKPSTSQPLSPTVTSPVQSVFAVPLTFAHFQQHAEYKEKTKSTNRKLSKFFGVDAIPLEIPVSEIRREGLKALLQSRVPLSYFLLHLLEEFSCENLFFFKEVEHYESMSFKSSSQQYVTASHIYDTYLSPHSQFELNLDDGVRQDVIANIRSDRSPHHVFDAAKRAVYQMLESSCKQFMQSDLFDQMAWELGEKTIQHPTIIIDLAIFHLYEHLRQTAKANEDLDSSKRSSRASTSTRSSRPSPAEISARRHKLITLMVYEFIFYLFGVSVKSRCDLEWRDAMFHMEMDLQQARQDGNASPDGAWALLLANELPRKRERERERDHSPRADSKDKEKDNNSQSEDDSSSSRAASPDTPSVPKWRKSLGLRKKSIAKLSKRAE